VRHRVALSCTTGYRMVAPGERVGGRVHACEARPSAPQRKAKAWPLANRDAHHAACRRNWVTRPAAPQTCCRGPSWDLSRTCELTVARRPCPESHLGGWTHQFAMGSYDATAECHQHFVEHLVCDDVRSGVSTESQPSLGCISEP
jgi:hypothetical protein